MTDFKIKDKHIIDNIKKIYHKKTNKEICKIYNISITKLWYTMKKAGEKPKHVINKYTHLIQSILKDYNDSDFTIKEISKKYNIPKSSLDKILSKHAIRGNKKQPYRTRIIGKSNHQFWTERYGKKIADLKLKECRKKMSKSSSGKYNSMYGRPPTVGSGNGWSGWYKNFYFRSLRELSYLLKEIEDKKRKWISAECRELTIPYKDYNGVDKTYRADFLVEDKFLIEIKPKRLWNSKTIKIKKKAAINFCKVNNLIYKIEDSTIDTKRIYDLYKDGSIKFLERYEKKFIQYISSNPII